MSKLKNRVSVDEKVAKVIQDHYRCTTPVETLNVPCFSQPQLQSHCCNKLEMLEGGEKCTYCGHDTRKLCEYSCDISKACLAMFAYRLGIGGEKMGPAMKKNLALDYEDLVQKIREVFQSGKEPPAEKKSEPVEEINEKPPEVDSEPVSPPDPPSPMEDVSGRPRDLITVKEASDLWGCTPPNVYSKIRQGKISAYVNEDSKRGKLVSKAEILAEIQKNMKGA